MSAISLQLRGLQKRFATNLVLRGIDLEIPAGKVTVLMGANGAGKSTLVKIVSGLFTADQGAMELDGKPFAPSSPSDAIRAGVVTVHQNINDGVVPDLDVASNLMLDQLADPKSSPLFNPRQIRKAAQEVAARLDLDLDVRANISSLTLADRQLVAIARAMAHKPRLLILDEPTSSLSVSEAARLFNLIDRLRADGVAILYISHRMSDIRRLADRIVSMRDGQISGCFETEPLDYEGAVNAMLGHTLSEVDIKTPDRGNAAFEARGLQLLADSKPFDLTLHRNEIVVVTGLVGVGKTRLADTLFGIVPPAGGAMILDGSPYRPSGASAAIDAGVHLCAKDRGSNGIVPEFDLARNISLPFLQGLSPFGFISRRREMDIARHAIDDLGIVCRSHRDDILTLSGGNQQKVMVARWLSQACTLLVLDEPFQGVDIAARRDIGRKLRETSKDRATLIMAAELDEALEVADRILVMGEHTIVGEHVNHNADIDLILEQVSTAQRRAQLANQSGRTGV